MVREASGLIRHLTAVLLVVVRFPLIDSLESAGAQPLANNSMLVSGESVDSSDDYDSSTITTRPNNTLLFDAINSNASLFFPRTLLDEAVGPLHDEAPVVPNVAHVNVPVGYLIGLSIGVCLLLFSMVGVALLQRRKAKVVLLPDHSIFATQIENKAWDSLSFSYGGGDSDVGKNPWESISDDSYLASLDEVIAQRASVISFQKRASAVVVPHPIGESGVAPATTSTATGAANTVAITSAT